MQSIGSSDWLSKRISYIGSSLNRIKTYANSSFVILIFFIKVLKIFKGIEMGIEDFLWLITVSIIFWIIFSLAKVMEFNS